MLANRITVTRQQHFFREQFEHVCGEILSLQSFKVKLEGDWQLVYTLGFQRRACVITCGLGS
jgi:hypothetical protein